MKAIETFKRKFSLLELVIVVAILAVVASFLVPVLTAAAENAEEKIVKHEMSLIRDAFKRLNKDCFLNDSQLNEIINYGLWPLVQKNHPVKSS